VRQNFNRFAGVLVLSAAAGFAIVRTLWLVVFELGGGMSKDKFVNEGEKRTPALGTTESSDDALVTEALRRFQARYMRPRPRTPEEVKVIETPLGFEPNWFWLFYQRIAIGAVDLAAELTGPGFFNRYRATARRLASRLQMEEDVDEAPLERAQWRWRMELAEGLRNRTVNSDDEREFCIAVLGELGIRLCRENCITYTISGMNTDAQFSEHQLLLHRFANEYTAMEFIRNLHWEVHSELVHRLPALSDLITFNPDDLRRIFEEIRASPESVRDYPRLLRLR
jgi:hypothetical protein